MRIARRICAIGAVSIILAGCHSAKRMTLDEVTVTATKAEKDQYRASAARVWDITHTRVALSFDWKQRTANGRAWLELHPYFYATDTLELDAKSMFIDSVVIIGGGKKTMPFVYKDDKLKIKLDKTYSSNEPLQLYIKYIATPYNESTGGSKAITDDRGLYFINTDYSIPGKPAQIWTQGETEANSHWLPTIDKPNERFTVQVELTVPDSFQTLSNGYREKTVQENNGMRTDIWVMDKPIQTYAIMFAIGKYTILKNEWRGKEVNYYVEPEFAPYGRKMFNNTPEMMDYFSAITGLPYPWNKYDQVVVRDYVSGAMENTSASLFGEFMNENFRELADRDYEDVVSHELFHQWFGDYVTAESWSNVTLNESFANYSELLWRWHKYGKNQGDELALQQLWQYTYGVSKLSDPALVRFYYADKEDLFDRVSYQKGGAILHYLNVLIGDDAFFKAMNIYLTKHALQPAEATQWRLAVEEATGQDWNWFFDQWYYSGGRPVLDLMYDYDDARQQLTVNITQTQKGKAYRLPVKAWVLYGNEHTVVDWEMDGKKQQFTYPYKNGVKPVVVTDCQHVIVGDINYNLQPWQWLAAFKQSNENIINKHFAIGESKKKMEDTANQSIMVLAMSDKEPLIREHAMGTLQQIKESKWHDKWAKEVTWIAANDPNNKVRAAAFDVLDEWDIKAAKKEMLEGLEDSSYLVAGAALDALAEVDGDTAYAIAKQMLKTQPKGELRKVSWERIGEEGSKDDVGLFAQYAPYFYGREKINFASSLASYLLNVKDMKAFDEGLQVLKPVVNNENIKSYRQSMGAFLFTDASSFKKSMREARNEPDRNIAESKYNRMMKAIDEIMKAEKEDDNLVQYRKYKEKLTD